MAMLDLQKAFVIANYDTLFKLHSVRSNNDSVNWIHSYVTSRE